MALKFNAPIETTPTMEQMGAPTTSAVWDIELRRICELNNLTEEEARRDPDVIAHLKDFLDATVQGVDAPKGKDGKRISQSIGSRGHETTNHLAAIRRWVGIEAYNKECRRIWKETPELAVKLNLEKPLRAGE